MQATFNKGWMLAATTSAGAAALLAAGLLVLCAASRVGEAYPVKAATIVRDGKPEMVIVAGSVQAPIAELRHYLKEISGAELQVVEPAEEAVGLHVGLAADFPWLEFENVDRLGAEGFTIRGDAMGRNLYLIGREPLGVQHAVTTFLQRLGCRWFFPGQAWEVIPKQETIEGFWSERSSPDFNFQRMIWYGFGAYQESATDRAEWNRHNRMGGPMKVSIGHTWHGLDPAADFEQHPDWFALVDGKRQPRKPCYSHPEMIQRAIEHSLARAAGGTRVISMSPPDGLGYCECERCFAVFQGGEPYKKHMAWFARRPDGLEVNATSETLFHMVNQVAAAVAEEYPDVLIGLYAYSAYSHPPSFNLHPNVYVQTTTAFRRTDLPLEDQIEAFGKKARNVGIREYYSVYQWDWDYPRPGRVAPDRLQKDLRLFRDKGVNAVNGEASNNWAARGLGYYVASRLLWDTDADVKAMVADFYEKAFGPAAVPMERYYVRWYGEGAAALGSPARSEPDDPYGGKRGGRPTLEALKAAFLDLDEAAKLVEDVPDCRARVDHLRMYLHYLVLRHRLDEAAESKDRQAIIEAVKAETVFGGRLWKTNMLHSRPLIGKAFHRRFRPHMEILKDVPEASTWHEGWRVLGEAPSREELEMLWAQDRASLGISTAP